MERRNYILILFSGGIDSTACINFYINLNFEVKALFVDFGQISRHKEYKAAKQVANYYKIDLQKISIRNLPQYKSGEVLGRNAFLIFSALLNFERSNGMIGIGVHKGTNYFDCSKEFINQIQSLLDKYSQHTIKIGTPFLHFNKKEILFYCSENSIPLKLTYSCENGKRQPCGACMTCKDLENIYASKK